MIRWRNGLVYQARAANLRDDMGPPTAKEDSPSALSGEVTMHYEMKAWIAERHRDADMARLVDAAQHAREARRQRSTRRLRPVLRLRRVFNRTTA
jgi:hypothetical protein